MHYIKLIFIALIVSVSFSAVFGDVETFNPKQRIIHHLELIITVILLKLLLP